MPRKPPWKALRPLDVLAVDPPGEVSSILWKISSRNARSPRPVSSPFELVHPPRGPGVDRRIDVAEIPLVGRELAVRVHVPLAAEQDELALGPLEVHPASGHAVKGRVPGREPGVLPLVGDRQHVERGEVLPARRSGPAPCSGGGGGLGRITLEPELDAVMVELLRPEQSGERLPLHQPLVGGRGPADARCRRTRRPRPPQVEDRIEIVEWTLERPVREPGPDDQRLARRDHAPGNAPRPWSRAARVDPVVLRRRRPPRGTRP